MKRLSALVLLLIAAPVFAQQAGQVQAPAPSCMAAIQVIGHNMEAVQSMPRYVDSEDGMDQVHYWLHLDTMASNLLDAMNGITHNSTDGAHCQKVINTAPRLYPAWRDKQDRMSTDRLVTIITVIRLMASEKAQMEIAASRDISH
jgi:hypothetical protein